MGDSEPRIEAWHDGTLCAGFSTELLRVSDVGSNVFVQQAVRERRAVLPTMDVRPHAVVIHIRVTTFFHSEQRVSHRGLRQRQRLEPEQDLILLVLGRTAHCP